MSDSRLVTSKSSASDGWKSAPTSSNSMVLQKRSKMGVLQNEVLDRSRPICTIYLELFELGAHTYIKLKINCCPYGFETPSLRCNSACSFWSSPDTFVVVISSPSSIRHAYQFSCSQTLTMATVFKIIPTVQQYDWGKIGNTSKVAQFATSSKLPAFEIDEKAPYAEVWVRSLPAFLYS